MTQPSAPLLAITPGEPAGIGPEIVVRLAHDHPELPLLAVADIACLQRAARLLRIDLQVLPWTPGAGIQPASLACLNVPLPSAEQAGQPNPAHAGYVLETLRTAVATVRSGEAGALVTGPVNKAVINAAGFPFSGHTEFLAELAGVRHVVMMLAAPGLRVSLVTTHLPLRAVADHITAERAEQTIRITLDSLRRQFSIHSPRLQVLGLNPHAGEGGYLGSEDDGIIRPVIERLQAEGARIDGPVPADTAFTPPRLSRCDAVVAMYHDQGLPVLKHMGFGESVNITLGLPFIRTSVDHGTALDIAGRGEADAGSLYHAVRAAATMAAAASAARASEATAAADREPSR